MWQGIDHRYINSTIKIDQKMSWVQYSASGFGTVVDRFRWEGGCIAEHVRILLLSSFNNNHADWTCIVGPRRVFPEIVNDGRHFV